MNVELVLRNVRWGRLAAIAVMAMCLADGHSVFSETTVGDVQSEWSATNISALASACLRFVTNAPSQRLEIVQTSTFYCAAGEGGPNQVHVCRINPIRQSATLWFDWSIGGSTNGMKYLYRDDVFQQYVQAGRWHTVQHDAFLRSELLDALEHVNVRSMCEKLNSLGRGLVQFGSTQRGDGRMLAKGIEMIRDLSPERAITTGKLEYREFHLRHAADVASDGLISKYSLMITGVLVRTIENRLEPEEPPPAIQIQKYWTRMTTGGQRIKFPDEETVVDARYCETKRIRGFGIMKSDGEYYVVTVFKPSPAYEAGVRTGYQLLRIGAKDITGLEKEVVTKILNEDTSSPFVFLDRNGNKVTLKIDRAKAKGEK